MSTPRTLWRLAGAFALGHVVLILAGISLMDTPLFSDGRAGIENEYVAGDLTRTVAGGLVEALGFLVLVPALVFLARQVGTRSGAARWAAETGLMCGVGYVVVTFAVGFPAGAAAMYGAQHGLDLDAAFALNNVRIFGYFLSLVLLAGNVLGVAAAALADDVHGRWFGVGGLVTGATLLAAPVLARWELQDVPTLIWLVWWVGVAVLMLRTPQAAAADSGDSTPERVAIGHS